MMIITIIISVVAILELIWIIYLCNRISFIKWSHNYWVDSYFQEVNKRIDFEYLVELDVNYGRSDMKKYEYALIHYDDLHLKEALDHCNKMGKEGWELVAHSVYCDSGVRDGCNVYHYYHFKREII